MTNETKKAEDFNFQTAHRASHLHAVTPKEFKKGDGNPKYSVLLIIDPENADLARLKTEVTTALKAIAGGKTIRARRLTEEEMNAGTFMEVSVPWKSGDKEADRLKAKNNGDDSKGAIYRGQVLLKASSKYQPALSAIVGGKIVDFVTDEAKAQSEKKYFYSGAYIVPGFGLNPYKGDANKPGGMALYFNAAMFAKTGERLGGRQHNAAEAFKGYIGTISQEDPGSNVPADELDDEIPF